MELHSNPVVILGLESIVVLGSVQFLEFYSITGRNFKVEQIYDENSFKTYCGKFQQGDGNYYSPMC